MSDDLTPQEDAIARLPRADRPVGVGVASVAGERICPGCASVAMVLARGTARFAGYELARPDLGNESAR